MEKRGVDIASSLHDLTADGLHLSIYIDGRLAHFCGMGRKV